MFYHFLIYQRYAKHLHSCFRVKKEERESQRHASGDGEKETEGNREKDVGGEGG